MAIDTRQSRSPVTVRFFEEPYRFDFQQAIRLVENLAGGQGLNPIETPFAFQLRSRVFLSAPPSDVYAYDMRHPRALWGAPVLEVNLLGLAGITGPLPMPYTEMILERKKARDHAMDDFLQIFNHRLLSIYRSIYVNMTPAAQDVLPGQTAIGKSLNAFAGLQFARHKMLTYAGPLWAKYRSIHQVRQILEAYFEVPVTLLSHEGTFKTIPPEAVTLLGRQHQRLGEGASLGGRYWDETTNLRVQVGPVPYEVYNQLKPGAPGHEALHEVSRMLLSSEYDVEIDVVLDQATSPAPLLGENVRLGQVAYM